MTAGAIRAGRAFIEVFLDGSKVQSGLRQMQSKLKTASAAFTRVGSMLFGGAVAAGTPIALATKRYADFEDQVAATAAKSQATPEQLKAISDQAKELGRTTSYTAVEIAALQTKLATMGFSPEEILAATPAIQNLGRATGTDLAESAEIAAATIREFNLSASDTTRVADVLTAAANSSAQSLTDIGESMTYVGPIAKLAGMSIEDTAKVLGFLANMGIKGSMAGTSLRRILQSLADPKISQEIEDMGGKVDLADPAATLKSLGHAMEKMTAAEKVTKMRELFDLRGMTGAASMAMIPEAMDRISDAIDNSGGAAQRTATMMDDTLGGTFRRVMSAAEGVAIAIGEALAPMLRNLETLVTDNFLVFAKWIEQNPQLVKQITVAIVAVGGLGAAFIGVGTAMTIAAMAVGAFATVIGLVLSPWGLLTAGVATFLGMMVDWPTLWGQWGTIAQSTIEAITKAWEAGDWSALAQAATNGIYAAFLALKVQIITIWEDIKLAIGEALMWIGTKSEQYLGLGRMLKSVVEDFGYGPGREKAIAALQAWEEMAKPHIIRGQTVLGTMGQMRDEAVQRANRELSEAMGAIGGNGGNGQRVWEQISPYSPQGIGMSMSDSAIGALAAILPRPEMMVSAANQAAWAEKNIPQVIGRGSVGSFDVRQVEAGLGGSLLDETKQQTLLLKDIRDNTEEEDTYGA